MSSFSQSFRKFSQLEKLRQLAMKNGFELLESEWLGSMTRHRFRHIGSNKEYEARPANLFASGFPKDLRTEQERSSELFLKLKQLAVDNGYELLEDHWRGWTEKHLFRHIESGAQYAWLPGKRLYQDFPLADGQRYVTQEVIRQVFSHIFGGEFNTNRDRLKSKNNGKPLELDGYEHFQAAPEVLTRLTGGSNEGQEMAFNLSVAFEFQGYPSHRQCEKTIRRDKRKAALCRVEDIHLIQIDPDLKDLNRFYGKVRDSDFMYAYVCKAIASHFGIDIDFPPGFKIDLSNWNPDKKSFQKLRQMAHDNGFELQETRWLGHWVKHRFRHIESGKPYDGTPGQLFSSGFPKNMYSLCKLPDQGKLEKLRQLARNNGYELLENQWFGSQNKHRFRHVESGKERQWVPGQLFNRGFPANPRTDQGRLDELRQLACDNGHELLEITWLGSSSKHRFRHIESGNEREWMPAQLFSAGFPKSPRSTKNDFERLRQLACDNGHELLETKWLGAKEMHRFRHIESGMECEWQPSNLFSNGFPKSARLAPPIPPASRYQASFAEAKKLLADGTPKDGSPDRLTGGQPTPENILSLHDDINTLDLPQEVNVADAPAP